MFSFRTQKRERERRKVEEGLLTGSDVVARGDETESVDVESSANLALNWWGELNVDLDVDWLVLTLLLRKIDKERSGS